MEYLTKQINVVETSISTVPMQASCPVVSVSGPRSWISIGKLSFYITEGLPRNPSNVEKMVFSVVTSWGNWGREERRFNRPNLPDSPHLRQEKRVSLVGDCGDCQIGSDVTIADNRVHLRIRLAKFRMASRGF